MQRHLRRKFRLITWAAHRTHSALHYPQRCNNHVKSPTHNEWERSVPSNAFLLCNICRLLRQVECIITFSQSGHIAAQVPPRARKSSRTSAAILSCVMTAPPIRRAWCPRRCRRCSDVQRRKCRQRIRRHQGCVRRSNRKRRELQNGGEKSSRDSQRRNRDRFAPLVTFQTQRTYLMTWSFHKFKEWLRIRRKSSGGFLPLWPYPLFRRWAPWPVFGSVAGRLKSPPLLIFFEVYPKLRISNDSTKVLVGSMRPATRSYVQLKIAYGHRDFQTSQGGTSGLE